MITAIYIGTDRLDLFKVDNIELKSSIVEIQDVSKIFTDSTNDFNVPATDNNNRIFKHFYNPNLVRGWDVFNKVDAVIELNGVLYKRGKINLNSVILKSNKPTSYSIQFYGLLTSLKDLLNDDKLSSLDFSSLDFALTANNAVIQLKTYFENNPPDIVRTTLSSRRMIYDSDSATLNTEDIKNVANNNTGFSSGLDWSKTGVSIRNMVIIEAIENYYGITFSRDYLAKTNFNNLYLLLNGKGAEYEIEEQIQFSAIDDDPTLENEKVLLSTNLTYSPTVLLKISISCLGDNKRDEFTSVIKANDDEIHSVTANGNGNGDYVYEVKPTDFDVFENLTFFFKSKSILDFRYTLERIVTYTPFTLYKSERYFDDIIGDFIISDNMPDLKIIDYVKGIFQKDKLVAINTSETEIYLDSLDSYYSRGEVKDITQYIDFKEIPISKGKIFNEINYKFKEPQTLLQSQFFNNNNVYYGDLEFKLVDINNNKIDGKSIDVELPFENMIYERLLDISGVDSANFQYGYMVDESLNPVTVKAHLHYVNQLTLTNDQQIKVLTGSDSYDTLPFVNIPSHTLGFNTPQYSTVFGNEFNEYNGNLITNTIFSNFHQSYIDEAFNNQKRLFQYKAKNLPVSFLLSLKLNDVLEIKDQYYRINKYQLNLITKECSFEVYNIKDLKLTPLESITWDSTEITWDSTEITFDQT